MSTTITVPAPSSPGKRSLLQVLGSDVRKVFDWLGSSRGQATIATGEGVVETVFPAAAGIIAIANAGLQEIIKVESMAFAAGQQSGSGTQKSAIVLQSLTPEILAYAEANKFPAPSTAKIQAASDSLVAFLNALSA